MGEVKGTLAARGYAAHGASGDLVPWDIARRAPGEQDIVLRILYCGICHSDLHAVDNAWGNSRYPLVPGHEIVGEVVWTGSDVRRLRTGDRVAVGTIIDSCRRCAPCVARMEQYCEQFPTLTYNGVDRRTGETTYGGLADGLVVDERFAFRLPETLDPARAAPLLCAGITVYSPLRHWQVGEGTTVGIVGLGGLGHLAIKFARAFGAHVVLFTTSEAKCGDALALGAHEAIVSRDGDAMAEQTNRFDFILDTAPYAHRLDPYLAALKLDGTLCSLGLPATGLDFDPAMLAAGRKRIASSGVGGTTEIEEMLDFCGRAGIAADVEILPTTAVNEAFRRLERGDVRYRFVIDLAAD